MPARLYGQGKGTRFLPGEESCKEASRRTGLRAKPNNLRLSLACRHASFRAKEKPEKLPKNKLACFIGIFLAFPCALCAQQGQLRWPARKRWTALLLQFAVIAFTATNGVSLLLSLTQREKTSRSSPSPSNICFASSCLEAKSCDRPSHAKKCGGMLISAADCIV